MQEGTDESSEKVNEEGWQVVTVCSLVPKPVLHVYASIVFTSNMGPDIVSIMLFGLGDAGSPHSEMEI